MSVVAHGGITVELSVVIEGVDAESTVGHGAVVAEPLVTHEGIDAGPVVVAQIELEIC